MEPTEKKPRESYPEALQPLFEWGNPFEANKDYAELASSFAQEKDTLIELANQETVDFSQPQKDEDWASTHALGLLIQLAPPEPAESFLRFLHHGVNDWIETHITEYFARVGKPALSLLQGLLENRDEPSFKRSHSNACLTRIAQEHEELKEEVIQYFKEFLGRSTADEDAVEETQNTFVISSLSELKAVDALPDIKRAFEEDRVQTDTFTLAEIETRLGLEPSQKPKESSTPLQLSLTCTACKRTRPYDLEYVYYDHDFDVDTHGAGRFDKIFIPGTHTCSKCGAENQYILSQLGAYQVSTILLDWFKKSEGAKDPMAEVMEKSPIRPLLFEALGQHVHPLEAVTVYNMQIKEDPKKAKPYLDLANIFMLGERFTDAIKIYESLLEVDPENIEATLSLGLANEQLSRTQEALFWWQTTLERLNAPNKLSKKDKKEFMEITSLHLAYLMGEPSLLEPTKAGRNDPCPCGSGKKFKKCCMRKS